MKLLHRNLTITIVVLAALALLVWWGQWLPGWKEPYTDPIEPPEETAYFTGDARPIEILQGSDTAVLLVHGFANTAQIWQYTAGRLGEAGYDVYAPTLPGHGTTVDAYEHTDFCQWYDWLKTRYLTLRARYRHLFVVGHSMGGAMTLRLAEETSGTPLEPDAIITISAIVSYNSLHDGVLTQPFFFLARPLSKVMPAWFGARMQGKEPAGKNTDGHEDWTGCHGTYYVQGMSLVSHLPEIRSRLDRVTCPVFAIQDARDRTVSPKNLFLIQEHVGTKDVRILQTHLAKGYRHTYHCLPMYHAIQKDLCDAILTYMEEKR